MDKEKVINLVTRKYYGLLFLYDAKNIDTKSKDVNFTSNLLFMEQFETSLDLLTSEERLFILNDFSYIQDFTWWESIMELEEYINKRHLAIDRFLILLIYTGAISNKKEDYEKII